MRVAQPDEPPDSSWAKLKSLNLKPDKDAMERFRDDNQEAFLKIATEIKNVIFSETVKLRLTIKLKQLDAGSWLYKTLNLTEGEYVGKDYPLLSYSGESKIQLTSAELLLNKLLGPVDGILKDE